MDILDKIISDALTAGLGIRVETPQAAALRAKLYPRLRKLNIKLKLEIRPGELWLIKETASPQTNVRESV